jgi:hypothetical protein
MKILIIKHFKYFLLQRRDKIQRQTIIKKLQLRRVFFKLREKHNVQKMRFEKERAARRKDWMRLTKKTLV